MKTNLGKQHIIITSKEQKTPEVDIKRQKEIKKIFHLTKDECLALVEQGKELSKTQLPKVAYCFMTQNRLDEMSTAISRVYDYVDKIIAVDGGSNDGTLEYLNNLGKVDIVHRKWDDQFDVQRSQYLNHVLKNYPDYWVLVSDTDEWYGEDLMKNLKYILLTSRNGLLFNRLGFLCWFRMIKAPDSPKELEKKPHITEENYKKIFYKKLCFKAQEGMKYFKSPHEGLTGNWTILCLGNPDWYYEHVKTRKQEVERGCRNYFVAGPGMRKNEEWQKFRQMCTNYGWHLWGEMYAAMIEGNLGDDVLAWIWSRKNWTKDGPPSSEQREYWLLFYEYLHPERAKGDKKKFAND